MSSHEQRIVVDKGFEAAVGEVNKALREEHMEVIARVDVRDDFRKAVRHDFRQYLMLVAWSPDLAFEAIRQNLAVGGLLPATFMIYELADGETAVVAHDHMSSACSAHRWRQKEPSLARLADDERQRLDRVLERLAQPVATPASA